MTAAKRKDPNVPDDLLDRLDEMVRTYKAIRRKERYLTTRADAKTSELRTAMKEIYDRYQQRLDVLAARRTKISDDFLEIWRRQFANVKAAFLPSAMVVRRRDVAVEVLDKRAVIAALDRLDRLDLVDYVIDEKGLKKLARDGKLEGLPESALKIAERFQIQATAWKDP